MAIEITYFVYGTTTDNEAGLSSGWKDVELTEVGRGHARANIKGVEGKNFDVAFCSDLKRAVESTQIIFGQSAPIIVDKRLRECNYGDYNGKASEIVEHLQEKNVTNKFPNGESYEDVKARIADFLGFLRQNYEGKYVAIVAHKAPQLALDVLLGGKTWEH